MVTWFAGLFYLPRLFVYHSMAHDDISRERFKVMEYKLYYAIMTPGAIVTLVLGMWLVHLYGMDWFRISYWLHAKLLLVALLVGFHLYCGHLMKRFAADNNQHRERFYRLLNEFPVIPLVGIVILVVVRPF